MHLVATICILSFAMLCGCVSPKVTNQPVSLTRAKLEPPREGKILVFISGNASHKGELWIAEGATLATLQDLVGLRPGWASRWVTIFRQKAEGGERLRVPIGKMNRTEKEAFKLNHGDGVSFHHDRCFGLLRHRYSADMA